MIYGKVEIFDSERNRLGIAHVRWELFGTHSPQIRPIGEVLIPIDRKGTAVEAVFTIGRKSLVIDLRPSVAVKKRGVINFDAWVDVIL